MTGARTPGRTHGAVPAVFVSRSAEIRAARRSRRRTASFRTGRQQPAPARFHRLRRVRGMGGKWLRERGPNQLRTMREFRGTKTIRDAAGGRENAPNFPFHPFSASGKIIPIGERPPSLSF